MKKENRKTSQPVVIRNSVQHNPGQGHTKRSIIESQQRETIARLEVSTRLEQDLKVSENRIEALKETLEDFASIVAKQSDETKIAFRQHLPLEASNNRFKDGYETPNLTQAKAVFNLQHQAAAYEREMRVLVSQLAAARDEVVKQYSEIISLNEDIAAINSSNRKLIIINGELASQNTRLCKRLVDPHEGNPHLSPTTISNNHPSA